jgi:hypothetical protein
MGESYQTLLFKNILATAGEYFFHDEDGHHCDNGSVTWGKECHSGRILFNIRHSACAKKMISA